MKKLLLLIALPLIVSCSKNETQVPQLDFTIEVKGYSSINYKTSEIDEFGIIKDSTIRKIKVPLNDLVIVKVAKITDPVKMKLFVNGCAIDSISLQGPLVQYEFTQYLTEKYLSKRGLNIHERGN